MLFSLDQLTLESSALKLGAMKENATLGERMQLALDESDVASAAQLAREVGTTETTIGNWLKNRVRPEEAKGALAIRIARRLRIRIEWLILNEKPMRSEGVTRASLHAAIRPEDRLLEKVTELAIAQAALTKALAATSPNIAKAFADELKSLPDNDSRPGLVLLEDVARRELANHEALHSGEPSTRGSGSRKSARS